MDYWFVPGILLMLGAIFTGKSAVSLRKIGRLRRRGVATTGRIVGQQESVAAFSPGTGSIMHAPVVRFTTQTGQVVQVAPAVRISHSTFIPGRPVTVHYDPARPNEAVIAGYETGLNRAFLAIGIVLSLTAGATGVLPTLPDDALRSLKTALLALIPVGLGLLFSAIGLSGVLRVLRLQRAGISVPGLVVGETTSRSPDGFILHHPVVRYALPDGQEVEVPSARGTIFRREHSGQQVIVRYDPADAGHMLLREDGPEPVFWIFSLVGVVVFAVGVAVVVALLA
jgi:Protein of unknown function (DUF3592)